MGLFSRKPKCDVPQLLTKLKISLVDEIAEKYGLSEAALDTDEHSQGIDITYAFVKRDVSPIRKKISYQVKKPKLDKETAEDVYEDVRAGLSRLVQIRLDELKD